LPTLRPEVKTLKPAREGLANSDTPDLKRGRHTLAALHPR